MSTTYVFVPIVVDGNKVSLKIYDPQQQKWVNYDQQHGEAVAVAYIRGVVHKFSQNGLELFYSGNPCHRLYGLIVKRSQQQQPQQQQQRSQQPQVINIQITNADYFVITKPKSNQNTQQVDQNIQQVEFAFDKFTFFSRGDLQEKEIDDNFIKTIGSVDEELKRALKGRSFYVVS